MPERPPASDPPPMQAAALILARVFRQELTEALNQGRLAGALAALRGLEHLAQLAGLTAAGEAFRTACAEPE